MKSKTFYKSRSNQNLANFQRKYKLSLKYTNTFLFERRELQLLNTQNSKLIKRKEKIYNTLDYNYRQNNHKKSLFEKNDKFTINSFSSFSSKTTRNLSLKKSTLYNLKKNNIPKLFLTEEALLQNKIIKKSEMGQKNLFNTDLDSMYSTQKQQNNSINFLLTIQKDLKEYRAKKEENNLINMKREKLHLYEKVKSRRGYITGINKCKYMECLIRLKKESEKTQKESKDNEIMFMKGKINSLNNILKLFSNNFINRISDYIRYLDSMKNKEYTKNINLIKEKNDLKREIVKINIDIDKLRQKKEEILRWVYLQIKLKERKLILPKYYKKIIEANKAEILNMEDKFDDNFYNFDIKIERGDKVRTKKLKRNHIQKNSFSKYNIKNDNDTLVKKNKNGFSYRSQKTVFNQMNKKAFNLLDNHSFEKNENNFSKLKILLSDKSNKIKEKEFDYLSKDEFNKIVFWKFRPIYQTVDEFMENLNFLSFENVQLLEYYNELQFKIYCLRQELVKVFNSRDKYDFKLDEQLKQKTSDLEKIRNKYKLILRTYEKINENKSINKKKKDKKESSKGFNEKGINKLYNKLNEIFDNCKIINNPQLTELIYYNIKTEKTKEGEMIYLIEYIECTLDFLFEKISLYNRDENLKTKVCEEKIKIEKQHRLEKPNKQKLEDRKKYINLIIKVMKKSQQQYIIPTRPLDLIHYDFRKLGRYKKKKILKIDDFPNLGDFVENPNIINNNENSFNSE